jgi:RNA polymerase sigma factor for flagellar operon FliA
MQLSLVEYQALLGDCGGNQLIYYEDFHAEEGGHDHFLDHYQADDGEDPLSALIEAGFQDAVVAAITALPEREKLLMGLYYEQELNLKEIGAVMGVSESRVSQLHSQAISRMRANLREGLWTNREK